MQERSRAPRVGRAPWLALAAAAGLALLLSLASPGQAISLQPHTQVADADVILGGGRDDLLPSSLAVGDWNGDNRSDLIVCSVENNSCWLYYGVTSVGKGTVFAAPDVIFVGLNGGFGSCVAFLGDVNRDGFEDFAVGAPLSPGAGGVLKGGSLWLFFGRPGAFRGQVGYFDANTTLFGSGAGDLLGASASRAGDVDRDGFADFWAGAPNRSEAGTQVGAAYLIRGRAAWATELNDTSAALRIAGAVALGDFGKVLLGGVDLDNDTWPDLLTSTPKYKDAGGSVVGAAFAFGGPFATDGRTLGPGDAAITFWGNALVPSLGAALAFADNFTREGGRTVFIGAPVYANNTSAGGSVYLFRIATLNCCQQLNTWDAVGLLYTTERNDQAGASLAAGGDIDLDGRPDLIVGAPFDDYSSRTDMGRVYILYGKDVGREPVLLNDSAEGLEGRADRAFLGAIVVLGDFNGDGRSDLFASSPGDPLKASQGGAAYGFVGRPRNRPPQAELSFFGDLLEGAPIVVSVSLFDPDDDPLGWGWNGGPPTSTAPPSLIFQYVDQGAQLITLVVFDGVLSNFTELYLEILNAPPVCNLSTASPFVEGRLGQVVLNFSDPGPNDILAVRWTGPPGMSYGEGDATYRPERGGSFTVNVSVADDDGGATSCEEQFDIVNVPPTVEIIGPSQIYENDSALFSPSIRDPGLEDAFFYNWSALAQNGTGASFVLRPLRPGLFTVQLRVTDLDGGNGFANATLRVIDLPPDVGFNIPDQAWEGDALNLSVRQYTGFEYDPLTISWLVCLEGYSDGATYRVPRARPGEFCVEALVYDDDGSSSPFSRDLVVQNRPPVSVVRITPSGAHSEGEPILFEPVIGAWETTPPSAITFSWYLDGDLVSEERRFELRAPEGSHRVGLRATDQDGGVASLNYTIHVVNMPPVVRIEGDAVMAPGGFGFWHAEASDSSGAEPELVWTVDGIEVGRGPDLQWSSRDEGTHVVQVTANDGRGGLTVASLEVRVEPPAAIGAGIDLRWVGIAVGAAAAFAAGLILGGYVVGRIRERRAAEDRLERRP